MELWKVAKPDFRRTGLAITDIMVTLANMLSNDYEVSAEGLRPNLHKYAKVGLDFHGFFC